MVAGQTHQFQSPGSTATAVHMLRPLHTHCCSISIPGACIRGLSAFVTPAKPLSINAVPLRTLFHPEMQSTLGLGC